MQSVKENRARPLFRVSGELCSEKAQNELDRVSIVRDVWLYASGSGQSSAAVESASQKNFRISNSCQ
jgi:hypothetical protein